MSCMHSAEHRQILNVQPAPLTSCTLTDTQSNDVWIYVITARQAKGQGFGDALMIYLTPALPKWFIYLMRLYKIEHGGFRWGGHECVFV